MPKVYKISNPAGFFFGAFNGELKYLEKHFVGVSWNDIFALPKIRGYISIAWIGVKKKFIDSEDRAALSGI